MLPRHAPRASFRRRQGLGVQKIPRPRPRPARNGKARWRAGHRARNARASGSGLRGRGLWPPLQPRARPRPYADAASCRRHMVCLQSFFKIYGSPARLQTSLQNVGEMRDARLCRRRTEICIAQHPLATIARFRYVACVARKHAARDGRRGARASGSATGFRGNGKCACAAPRRKSAGLYFCNRAG